MKFNRRLERAILNKYKNIKQFAESYDLNYSGIRGYVLGTSEPTLSKVEELAKYLDVSASWLAYGVEDNSLSDNKIIEIIDLGDRIQKSMKKWAKAKGKKLSAEQKAKILVFVYNQLQEKEKVTDLIIDEQVSITMDIAA